MVTLFFIILISFATVAHAQDQSGFLSIDCGILDNSTYSDGKTGIYYVSDAGFLNTENGISKSISPLYQTNDLDQQLVNVRSFPQGIKNCYTLKPPRLQGRNHYFIRARFLYGNYDIKSLLPTFDLYLGVDYWTTIGFGDGSTPVNVEILHVPRNISDYTYVCLVNTGLGTPFISALEVRLVDDAIYPALSGSLNLVGRYDLRSYENRSLIRYGDDAFDRIWRPSFFSGNSTSEINTQINLDATYQNSYKLPSVVMQTAITPQNASKPIEFWWMPMDLTAGYYLYLHFADFQSNLTREFDIKINNETWFSKFQPGYLSTTTVYSLEPRTPTSRVNFTLIKTARSMLPPILNALELYTVQQFSYQLTDQGDLKAIEEIKATYGLKKDWQGDPCLPTKYLWEGIGCFNISSDEDPRIISLNLSVNGLTGNISPLIFNLKMLKSLDLSHNILTGEVPSFLAQMQHLDVLILSGNNLSGVVPAELIERSKNGLLKLSLDGNPNLCVSESCVPATPTPAPAPI